MKYCCDKFKFYAEVNNTSYPNIRIVKIRQPIPYNSKSSYRFFITMGYQYFNMDLPMMNIAYCPYCGIKLFDVYKSDEFVHEIEGVTFEGF